MPKLTKPMGKPEPILVDARADVYNMRSLLVIAKRTWRYGNRQGDQRWIDADRIGVTMRRAIFLDTETREEIHVFRWVPVGSGLEVYIDGNCRAGWPGRFVVRKQARLCRRCGCLLVPDRRVRCQDCKK